MSAKPELSKELINNVEQIKALQIKHGDNFPFIAVAALGGLSLFVSRHAMTAVLKAAEKSVFVLTDEEK